MATSRVNVLVVSSIYPREGSPSEGIFIHRRTKQLAHAGLDVHVFTRRHITLATYLSDLERVKEYYTKARDYAYEWDGIRVEGRRMHLVFPVTHSWIAPKLTYRAIRMKMTEMFREHKFQVMQLATWGDFALAASWVAREHGIPYVASAIGNYENYYYDKSRSVPYRLMVEIFGHARLVVCNSDDLRRKVQTLANGSVEVITFQSGVDTTSFCPDVAVRERFRRLLGFGREEKVLTFIGRVERSKGVEELVETFLCLRRDYVNLRLLIVGAGPLSVEIQARLDSAGAGRSALLTGAVAPERIPGYLNASDVFVFPSWMEGLPNVVLEAAACGLPIVATRVGGVPEIIEDGRSGILVNPKTMKSLREAVELLIRSQGDADKMGKAARHRIMERFDYSKNGDVISKRIEALAR